jgi:polysaccharide biosynthesis/export protein
MRLSLVVVLTAAAVAALVGTTIVGASAQDRPIPSNGAPNGAPNGVAPNGAASSGPMRSSGPAPDSARRNGGDPAARASAAYRLRPDDEIEITVHRPGTFETQFVRRLVIPADGNVSVSPVGTVPLLDRTTRECEEEITRRLKDQNLLNEPNVGCVVTRYAPRTVSVIGAVRASVDLPVHRDLRILELLSRVGGLEVVGGDFSRVEIRRTGPDGRPFHFEVNVDDVFARSDEERNIVIREGDVVKIPRLESSLPPDAAEHVYVLGKVNQRGRVPLNGSRGRPLTLVKLIALCGDFTEFADRAKVRVIRHTETGRRSEIVDFDDILEGKRLDFEMRPDDVVFVPETFL